MTASDLISDLVSPAKTSDTGEELLTMMGVYHLRHLPIVNNKELLGVISEDEILSQDVDAAVGSYPLSMRRPFVEMDTNVIDMMRSMSEYNLTAVPVIDHKNVFMGMVLQEDIIKYFGQSATFTQPGSVIFVEVNRQDYSLHEITRIIEHESAAIIGMFIFEHANPNSIRVVLKLNTKNLKHILAGLQRYEYIVEASFSEDEVTDSFQDRYDSLMNYLNV